MDEGKAKKSYGFPDRLSLDDILNDKGVMVEPDVRKKLKDFYKSFGLGESADKKIKITVSELRDIVREVLSKEPKTEAATTMTRMGLITTADAKGKCPKCGAEDDDVTTWAEDGESADADWAECTKCGHYGKADEFFMGEGDRADVHVGMEDEELPWVIGTEDDELGHEDEREKNLYKEFKDFGVDFGEEKLSDKQYEAMARQLYDAWADKAADVNWHKVVSLFARNRSKNIGIEIDRDKLYEKVLSVAETKRETTPLGKGSAVGVT